MNNIILNRIDEIKKGEVPEGYEKTSLGIFPADWEKRKTFDDLFSFYGGLGKSREELGETGIAYLHYGDMHRSNYSSVSYEQYEKMPKYNTVLKGNEKYLMNDGDIVFVDASEDLIGTSRAVMIDNINNKPFIAGLHTFLAKEKSNSLNKYFKQYLTMPFYIKKQFQTLANGFKVYGLNRNTIKKIKVAYPKSPVEQQQIANVLMVWDKAIEAQNQYITTLEKKKKALMQKLLQPKPHWQKIELSKVLKERKTYSEKGQGFEHVSLTKDGIIAKGARYERDFLVKEANKEYKITYLNDICYNPANLKFGVISRNNYGSAIFSPIYVTFIVKEGFDVYFVDYYLTQNNFIQYIRKYEEGTIYERMAVKPSDFLLGVVDFPQYDEQKEIASILAMADAEISMEKAKLELYKLQKKSLMQLLLTGIVRTMDS